VSTTIKTIKLFLICLTIAFPVTSFAEELNMAPGLWDQCGSLEDAPVKCITQNYTADDLKGNKIVLPGVNQDKECLITRYNQVGNTIEWESDCCNSKKAPNTSDGKITYSGTVYEGVVKTKLYYSGCKGDGVIITTHLKGHLLKKN